jgi:presenilin-like A22 family membrane protease
MFLLAQLIGILVINAYNQPLLSTAANQTNITQENLTKPLPFDLGETESPGILSLLVSIALAFAIFFTLMKYKLKYIIKIWFFCVIVLALSVSLNAFIANQIISSSVLALLIAIPLTILKIFRPSMLTHNGTEILIYPGIAAIISPLISIWGIIILLILIALYDAWAVWHSGLMQKMAKYQMEEVKIFGGLLIPHMDKKTKAKIKTLKQKYKKAELREKLEGKRFKINLAILGGGDIVFPIITMGVFMRLFPEASLFGIPGLIPALFILGGSFLALTHLFLITRKGKAYPAMPWISSGILMGLLAWWLIF